MTFAAHPGAGIGAKNPDGSDIIFAVIGDLGQTANSASTIAHVEGQPGVTTVVHVGDLSYADSDEPRWDAWQNLIAPLSQHTPYMTQVGNRACGNCSVASGALRELLWRQGAQ